MKSKDISIKADSITQIESVDKRSADELLFASATIYRIYEYLWRTSNIKI